MQRAMRDYQISISMPGKQLLLPNGQPASGPRIVTARDGTPQVQGLMSRQQWNQLEAIYRSKWVLMRNDGAGYGERLRCKRCNALHMYLTYCCIERPFRGLVDGLWATYRAASED